MAPLAKDAATQVSLSYAYQHAKIITESKATQYTLGLSNKVDSHLEGHGTLNYWNDSLNDVHYAGPSMGLTYTWTKAETPAMAAHAEGSEEKQAPSAEGPTLESRPPPDEAAALTFNSDLFIYGTDISASPTLRRVRDPVTHRLVNKVIAGGTADVHLTQLHPSMTFELPLFDQALTPSVTAGHYFYSRDPGDFEALIGRPRFSGSANQINGLVGGFLNNNAEAALEFTLPGDIDTSARLGTDQIATDQTWAITQGVTFNYTLWDHLKAKLDWSRSIQSGISSDIFTGGLTYQF